ncbi:MAG: cytochrome c [Methylotenera sp.]|nr:cytochrome c [Methylotenera sp.]
MKSVLLASFLMLSNLTLAAPYTDADATAGNALVSKNCINCHAQNFGGDGSDIYTRKDRKVKTSKGLVAQVRNCNTNLGLKWFEDEELNVAKYLNQTYYKFTD